MRIMKKIFLLLIMSLVCHHVVYGQTLAQDVDGKKLNAQANTLAQKFCDCIVKVGSSSNGISYSDKKKLINNVGNNRNFYNYHEDPRMMTTTRRNGKPNQKPISTYLNNLLAQSVSTNSLKIRKYEIRWEMFKLNGDISDWKFEKKLSDGCELYSKEFVFYQTYRVIDVLNKNPEHQNVEHVERDKKIMKVLAIKQPGSGNVSVRLGDITRSECVDGRK